MTPFGSLLKDNEIAAVLTYVRNTFGNNARPVTTETVARIRKEIAAKQSIYMVDEILKEHPLKPDEVSKNRNK